MAIVGFNGGVQTIVAQNNLNVENLNLDATLKLLQDRMTAQGPIQYAYYSKSCSGCQERHKWDVVSSQTNFVTDTATCSIQYQDSEVITYLPVPGFSTTPPTNNVSTKKLSLKSAGNIVLTAESVSVTDGAHEGIYADNMQKHPTMVIRVDPSFFVVHLKKSDLYSDEFFLHTEADAHIVAEALQHAISLCNHSGKELF
jgi:hypothetical protein